MTPPRALVIGYGSPIRGDDAIGPLVAERLAADGLPTWVRSEARHVLTADLVPELADVERVVFLDAAVDLPPGAVRCQPLAPATAPASSLAHSQDPRELLAWCGLLYRPPPLAWLITAGGADFGYAHCRLSTAASAAVAPMLAQIKDLLDFPASVAMPTDSLATT